MLGIAQKSGFDTKVILTKDATRDVILTAIRNAATKLGDGDIFLITYSGHGDNIPDVNANPEDKGFDQAWCLYDGELLDKELYAEWSRFSKGVRILVISDSCHSQGITKAVPSDYLLSLTTKGMPTPALDDRIKLLNVRFGSNSKGPASLTKAVPPDVSIKAYTENKAHYDELQKNVQRPSHIDAWVLSITACANSQLCNDGAEDGVFTEALKSVWKDGSFYGNYKQFHSSIEKTALRVNPGQDATRRMEDSNHDDYWKQRPFAVNP